MSETLPAPAATDDPRLLPAVVYGLYLIGLLNGLTIIVGLIIAYVNRDKASPAMRSHYLFQTRTCWMALALAAVCVVVFLIGIPLALVAIGFVLMWIAGVALSLIGVWFALRCILGLYYLAQSQAYPRPNSWLV